LVGLAEEFLIRKGLCRQPMKALFLPGNRVINNAQMNLLRVIHSGRPFVQIMALLAALGMTEVEASAQGNDF
jgi:hypothetical protein